LKDYYTSSADNTVSLHYRARIFFLLLVLLIPAPCYSETDLNVILDGVRGRLHDNVMARLRINRYAETSQLGEAEIRRLHRLAEADIQAALAPFGYYSVMVTSELDQTETGWQAIYHVLPGEPISIAHLSIRVIGEGADLPELAKPETFLDMEVGSTLLQGAYEDGKRDLLRQARALGFLDAAYTVHEIRIDRTAYRAEIELVMDTGPRYLFGEITSSQQVISDDLLDRFMQFEQGDWFVHRQLQELQRDLYRTDYFSLVSVKADIENSDGVHVPVTIELEPLTAYNRYSFGVGYATDTRAHVRLEWTNRLLNQSGHSLNTSLLVGEQESHCVVNYRIPVADPRFNSLTGFVLWNRELWEDTVTSMYSGGLSYQYLVTKRFFGVSLEILKEDYRIGDTTGNSELLIPGIKGSWAIADSVINTENGLRTSVELHGASEELVSDTSFLRMQADGRLIISPLINWRLIGRGSVGYILVDSIDDLPPSQRFYAGGERSVRGYRYRTLGPEDASGNVIGGKYMLTGSVEFERRLSELWRAVGFYDVGNAMDDFSVDFAHGVGVGIGLALPFGQARLEVAYPLREMGNSQYVFLSVGADL
jgi:translocation and assembly module TamA